MGVGRGSRFVGCTRSSGAVLALALALGAGAARSEEAAAPDSSPAEPAGLSYSVEATSSIHHVSSAYFGADWGVTRDPRKTQFSWGEGLTRARVGYRDAAGFHGSVGGVLLGTSGTDYFGTHDVGDGRLDQLLVGGEDVAGTGLGFVLGRQDLQVGDGFVIGDGYYDRRAALWNIPLGFTDAARLDWGRGRFKTLAFVSRLSPSFMEDVEVVNEDETTSTLTLRPRGTIAGGEIAYVASEQRSLALAYFQRDDRGDTRLDARAASVRGALGTGPFRLSGEWVVERGYVADAKLRGRGGHLCANAQLPARGEPYVEAEYLLFSGDDPATPEDEAYYPWQYRWNDWSQWYVADLLGSTLVFNSNSRVWRFGCGITPLANTTVRLLAHHVDLDTGVTDLGEVPAGVGRGFADETDLIVDQSIGEHWSAWVMGGYVYPRNVSKALVGNAKSGQVFASVTYKFARPGGGEE